MICRIGLSINIFNKVIMAIVIAIIGGGIAMLIFKDEIVEWIISKDFKCPECGQVEWKAEDSSKLDVAAITATPRVIRELVEDESATATYRAEDTSVSYDTAEAALYASLPANMPEAVKAAVIKASQLSAQLMKEQAEKAQK